MIVKTIDNGLRTRGEFQNFGACTWCVTRSTTASSLERNVANTARKHLASSAGSAIASGRTVVEVVDDGRGIDWQRVRERARELGMRAESEQDLLAALWADGLSTNRDVSDISGRGVGLSSVLQVCKALGIRTQVESRPHAGTTFRFTLPEDAAATSARERRVPAAS